MIGRTLSVLVPLTLATSLAAREGPVPMAGYQICVEIWMTISLLTDALAIAGQVIPKLKPKEECNRKFIFCPFVPMCIEDKRLSF